MSNIVKKKIKNVLSNEDRKSLKLILKFCKNNNYLSPFQRRVLYLNGKLDNITEDSIIFLYKTLNDFYPEHIFEKYLESEEIKLENGLIIPKTLANLSIDILDKIEIKYLQISSDKNDKVAQYKLARKLSSTMDPKVIGISNDLDKAFELFKKSSDQLYP